MLPELDLMGEQRYHVLLLQGLQRGRGAGSYGPILTLSTRKAMGNVAQRVREQQLASM